MLPKSILRIFPVAFKVCFIAASRDNGLKCVQWHDDALEANFSIKFTFRVYSLKTWTYYFGNRIYEFYVGNKYEFLPLYLDRLTYRKIDFHFIYT